MQRLQTPKVREVTPYHAMLHYIGKPDRRYARWCCGQGHSSKPWVTAQSPGQIVLLGQETTSMAEKRMTSMLTMRCGFKREETADVNHEAGTMTCLRITLISSSTSHIQAALMFCSLFAREAVSMFCSSNLNRPHNGTTRLSRILHFFSSNSPEIRKCISDSCMARSHDQGANL